MVKFTDLFNNESSNKYGIRRSWVRDTITNYDKIHEVQYKGVSVLIFTKHINITSNNYLLMVLAHKTDTELLIDLAFKVFPDLVDQDINNMTPLDLLETFIENFGLEINIGNITSKLIYEQNVPVTSNKPNEIIKVHGNQNSFILNSLIKIKTERGKYIAQCALVFCLDTKKYDEWLSEH